MFYRYGSTDDMCAFFQWHGHAHDGDDVPLSNHQSLFCPRSTKSRYFWQVVAASLDFSQST